MHLCALIAFSFSFLLSTVQQRIDEAEHRVKTNASSWQSYNDLAFALCRQARDREDTALYGEAEKALQHSLQLSPGNYEAEKLEVVILLGKREFTEALKLATDLNHKVPDDIGGWGLLVDTNSAVGNYPEAETAAQWILDLRPGSALGFEKAAQLREVFGDAEGAIEFLDEANRRTSQNDADQRAWFLTQTARLQLASDNPKRAEELIAGALKLFPESQLALAVQAKIRTDQAASLFEKRYRAVASSHNLYDWAEALDKSGMKKEATTAFGDFETKARSEHDNLDLIYFYVNHKANPAEALRLAVEETRTRHDVATLDAYAWALFSNGKYEQAKAQMDRALAVGVRDPGYFCHAARIAIKTNDAAGAERFAKELKGLGTEACAIEQSAPPRVTGDLGSRTLAEELLHKSTDERIRAYESRLAAAPDDFRLQTGLTGAYLQKLRESGDRTYLDRASKLVDRMLEKDGGNSTALRFQNEIDLQRHEFKTVAERAEDMAKYAPSDPGTWGNLGDALMELGEYQRAGEAYSKMFALRPGLASYNRMAYFRFVTGDAQSAIALMRTAIEAGDPQPENTAWCWAELGDLYFKTGQLAEAETAYNAAVGLFPTLHRAAAGLGKVAAAQGDVQGAIRDYERAQSIVPMVEYAGALEDLYAKAGMSAKAEAQRKLLETIKQLGQANNEKTNRNLALVLADHDRDLKTALELMETEIPVRGDVYTWDALAWVLFKNGRLAEAKAASAKALKLGTPEPVFYYHAAKIAEASGGKS